MFVPIYKDLDKSANDLHTRGFAMTNGFEVEGETAQQTKFKFDAKLAESMDSLLEISSSAMNNSNFKFAIRNEGSNQICYVESLFKNPGIKNLDMTLRGEFCGSDSKQVFNAKSTSTYYYKNLFTGELVASHNIHPEFTMSMSTAYKDMRAGASTTYSFSPSNNGHVGFKEYSCKLQYFNSPSLIITQFLNFAQELKSGFSLYYKNQKNTEFAADAVMRPLNLSEPPCFRATVSQILSNGLTLKGRISNCGALTISAKQQLNPSLFVTVVSELSTNSKTKVEIMKMGILVNLKL